MHREPLAVGRYGGWISRRLQGDVRTERYAVPSGTVQSWDLSRTSNSGSR